MLARLVSNRVKNSILKPLISAHIESCYDQDIPGHYF